MKNLYIRQAASNAGVRLWQIADAMGIADSSFSRKLRKELSPAEQTHILSIIADLAREVS